MPRAREVYLLNPQEHTPETIAVAFAKTSRSPESFRQITAELSNEKSAQFHEKWVVGYGHSSVAEHAVLHIAIENLSRLAVECLESNRLASYTEKSTRYQKWGGEDFYIPDEFSNSSFLALYLKTCTDLFKLYEKSLPRVQEIIEKEYSTARNDVSPQREHKIRTAVIDVCRFLLPVSAYANVGVTINARALEHGITKMLSHPLQEVRSLGQEIKIAAQANIPTLLKYADEQHSLHDTESSFIDIFNSSKNESVSSGYHGAKLLQYDPDCENAILAAAAARYAGRTYTQARMFIDNATGDTKRELLESIFLSLKDHDIPIRELEYGEFLFEIILDQGAYLELKRHRMMTQTPLPFSTQFGYSIPAVFEKAGLLDEYQQTMDNVDTAYRKLHAISPHAAAYVLPNAYNRCVIIKTNFRSLYHFLALRSAPNAHFSMRRIAHQMADQVRIALPQLGAYLKINSAENTQLIEDQFFLKV